MKNILTALFIALTFTLSANQDSTAVIIEETSNDFIIGPGYPYGYGQYEASISRWNGGSRNVTEDFSSPFYMTFTVEKQLKKAKDGRWNIGFGFGILNVKSTFSFENEYEKTEQNLRRTYGVLPVYVKYNFVQKEKISTYISAGVNAEIGLNGKNEITGQYPDGNEYTNTENFPLGLGQLNSNMGVGVGYAPVNKLRIFAELNAAVYFGRNTNLAIWSQKRVWTNLKTGVSLLF